MCRKEGLFNGSEDVGEFIRGSTVEGFGYHLVAVFGSQSTGKSSSLGGKWVLIFRYVTEQPVWNKFRCHG